MHKFNGSAGKKVWAFAAGHIPLRSTGMEPFFTSHDKIAILNTSSRDAEISLEIFYSDEERIKGYKIKVKAGRLRKVRINDIIDPLPVPLDMPYSFILISDTNVIIQFSRMNTSSAEIASFITTPYFRHHG